MSRAPVDWVRRPEYTGPNRCWPCTVLNLGIVAATGALAFRWGIPASLTVVGVGLALVALRGYVVPGTPRFAPRLVAGLPVAFGHADRSLDALGDAHRPADGPTDDRGAVAVLEALVEAGVLTDAGEDLFLDEAFREAWTERMAGLRTADDETLLGRVADACPADVEGQRHGDRVILAGERDVRTSRAVAIVETAAVETLGEWGVDGPTAARAAAPLRTFLRTCPACGGRVRETTRRNCCGGPGSVYGTPEQSVLACEECATVVVELDGATGA
ncbi:MAG: hypothetical protein V5A44_09875 [Haloarculaceae archaeon]